MARYDYGLRGPGDTMDPRYDWSNPPYDSEMEFRHRYHPPLNRVTARYNRDYVHPRGERFPINHNPYGGEWYGHMGGEGGYRYPYMTRGGTRTSRGTPGPFRYDFPDYGPGYGGRYPDEL